MKRIILTAIVIALVAAMLAASALSVGAQGYEQYASTTGQGPICAPWSKTWDISQGKWWFQWTGGVMTLPLLILRMRGVGIQSWATGSGETLLTSVLRQVPVQQLSGVAL